jgi:hypothetical protein
MVTIEQAGLDWEDMLRIASRVSYKGWQFHVEMREGPSWLQLRFHADGRIEHCRKWMLSSHMTESEFVQTCLKAVLSAEEHEARENFTYKGKKIFGPHINVNSLLEVADSVDVRSEYAK